MKQRIIAWSVLIAVFATLAAGTTGSASNDEGFGSLNGSPLPVVGTAPGASCDGLAGYSDAMLQIGARWIKGMQHDGLADRSTRTYSAAEWDDYATRASRLLSDLREIDPPAFAAPWHDAMVDSTHLRINFARSASLIGFDYAADMLATRVAATSTEVADARQSVTESCSDFATFSQSWDLLDGQTATANTGD